MHLSPSIATVAYLIGIAGLFWLDRDGKVRLSKALLIPTAWLLITGSRPVSMWLGVSPEAGAVVYEEGSPVDRAVYIALEVGALIILISRSAQAGPILRKNWPILLFFFYAALSILWSDDPFVTLKHWIKGIGDVAMVLIILTEPDVMDAIERLVTRIGFILLPLSVLLCKYYPGLGRFLSRSWEMEWTGVAMQKNALGGICIVYGLGLLWRFRNVYERREDPSRRRRLLAISTVLLMTLWLLWKCKSMSAIAALGIGGTVMFISERPAFRRQPVFLHIVILVVLSITVYAVFLQSSGEILQDIGKDPTLTGRTEIWKAVLSVPVNPVVGAGYESFWLEKRLDDIWMRFPEMHINEAHNGYLEMYLNLGWIGVLLLAGMLISGYRAVSAAFRRDPDTGGLYLGWLLATAIRGLAEAAFRMLSSSWIFFLLAAMGASQVTERSEVYEADNLGDRAEHDAPAELGLGSPLFHW